MRALVPVGLVVLIAAGCGGGSGGTTTRSQGQTSAAPPSKADFLALADTICKNHQSRREDLESQAAELGPITTGATAHRIAALLRKESRNREAEARELEGLQGPPAGAARVVAAIRVEASVIEEWARAYSRLDSAGIRRLQIRLGTLSEKTAKLARTEGFQVCGRQ